MSNNFGPWATAMAPGPQLSTFWKRRMAMLTTIPANSARPNPGQRTCLVLLAAVLLIVPTITAIGVGQPPGGGRTPQPPGGPPDGLPGAGADAPAGAPGGFGAPGQPPSGGPAPWQVLHDLRRA